MNRITKFFHELRNPHCEHCERLKELEREEARDNKVCVSCETLQRHVERLYFENDRLTQALIDSGNKQLSEPSAPETTNIHPIRPRNVPWSVRRQALEQEDRHKAKLMRDAPKPQTPAEVSDETKALEEELGVAEQAREATTK